MLKTNFYVESQTVEPRDFAGQYSFYHDGWHGTLKLKHVEGQKLTGNFYSDRFDDNFRVTAEVDEKLPHQILIIIHKFNWMDKQLFTGYIFTRSKNAIAGFTEYEPAESDREAKTPFGFFARKTGALFLRSTYKNEEENVEPEDFAGRYSFYYDGWHGTLNLKYVKGQNLAGNFNSDHFDGNFYVTAEVDEKLPHRILIAIHEFNRIDKQLFTGYLFMRPKNAIAGSAKWNEIPFGFYMTKW